MLLLISEIVAVTILLICLAVIRANRLPSNELILSDDLCSDEAWAVRKIREEEAFYGGTWRTGNQGRWD